MYLHHYANKNILAFSRFFLSTFVNKMSTFLKVSHNFRKKLLKVFLLKTSQKMIKKGSGIFCLFLSTFVNISRKMSKNIFS